jgi:CheY-like chemotaxis protein
MTAPVVFVVEDEPMIREVIVAEFEDAGYVVTEAEDAETAERALADGAPCDLLFTDIRLPGALDGFDLAERARVLRPELPVIFATGYTAKPVRMVPGSRLFRKPFSPSELIDAARALGVG